MARIVAIQDAGPRSRGRRLVAEDGEVRTTSASVVKALGLEVGVELDELAKALAESEAVHARERALALLGYRERSQVELARKLVDDGFPARCVGEIVDAYVRVGLLDDERYAEGYVRSRMRAGFGSLRITRELDAKGVPEDVAHAAVDDAVGEDPDASEVVRARSLIRGPVPVDRAAREKLLRRLVNRGFSFTVARAAVDPNRELEDEC